ncbi:MAG: transposase [Planctomycetes bacterium]|nr:transposase [Planctomycetota bacterium]
MVCHKCGENAKKNGKDRNDQQRYRCKTCKKTFVKQQPKPLGNMNLPMEKAVFCLKLLLEGTSIRATERLTGINRNTICSLVVTVGKNCKRFLERAINNIPVNDIQCDETWGFVGCKERTAEQKGYSGECGDAYCFVGIERNTKLVVAWHLGKRSSDDTWAFTHKLYVATTGRYQISTDGWGPYQTAIPLTFRYEVDFGIIIKSYGKTGEEGSRQYSPASIISIKKKTGCGNPDSRMVSTSHCERFNLTLRMGIRRLTRLTNAHSKKWENHEAMLGLYFAFYNFCRPHSSLENRTPAWEHGLTDRKWTIEELLQMAATQL